MHPPRRGHFLVSLNNNVLTFVHADDDYIIIFMIIHYIYNILLYFQFFKPILTVSFILVIFVTLCCSFKRGHFLTSHKFVRICCTQLKTQ